MGITESQCGDVRRMLEMQGASRGLGGPNRASRVSTLPVQEPIKFDPSINSRTRRPWASASRDHGPFGPITSFSDAAALVGSNHD